jgi:hypothetical protein
MAATLISVSMANQLPLLIRRSAWRATGHRPTNHPAGQLAFVATTLVGLWPVARQALRLIKSGSWFATQGHHNDQRQQR